jgi:hypothetical protein
MRRGRRGEAVVQPERLAEPESRETARVEPGHLCVGPGLGAAAIRSVHGCHPHARIGGLARRSITNRAIRALSVVD